MGRAYQIVRRNTLLRESTPVLLMQRYKIGQVLGEGAFGTVCEAVNVESGELVGLKRLRATACTTNEYGANLPSRGRVPMRC